MLLSQAKNPLDVTGRMPSYTGIPTHVNILYGIKGIHCRQEDLTEDVVSKDIGGE